jgi:hypothetical protein
VVKRVKAAADFMVVNSQVYLERGGQRMKKAKANSGDAPKRSSFPFFNKLKAQPKCHYNKTTNGRNENGPNSVISAVFETCTKCT